ncbi:glycosyltransferase family 4 protein [Clostridium botulinum]|uniref:glycosyltransferase family 4 protein n=1 Tax=Clostridium botulinum TaxID=1491 RepID=UPI00217D9B0D|nr:glycosyltransferase family 4 protein [Clostridium botulinum]
MKVLIMNDFLVCGGAEMQGIREKNLLEKKGHEVYLLTFDNDFPLQDPYYNLDNGYINLPMRNVNIKKKLNSLGFFKINNSLLNKIRNILNQINPDIIHVNNLMQDSFTQYKALEGYRIIQTIRDYVSVCPLGTCIKNKTVCNGENKNNCYKECGNSIKNIMKIKLNNGRNVYRKKYIQKYICPSQNLTSYCSNNNYDIKCINNPFDFNKFKGLIKKIDFEKKIYLYYGAINTNKGVINLINAFNKFSQEKSCKLLIAGQVFDEVKDEFKKILRNSNNIEYLGVLKYEEMINVLEIVHTIVVPSVWMENYPNTVLEGLATGTLVVGSTRGGIPEMINNEDFIFDVNYENQIIKVLNKSYNLSKNEYSNIVNQNKNYVKVNNSLDKYYHRLINEFNNLL